MQPDIPTTEENVEKADRVVQTEATENEQEEPEKMDSISDDSEMEPIITKKNKNYVWIDNGKSETKGNT